MKFLYNDKKGGFTLVEILCAILIIIIALVSVLSVFFIVNTSLVDIYQTSVATMAATEEIESIRNMAFDDILTAGSSFTAEGFSSLINPIGTLTVDNPYGTNNMRRVTVSVTWYSSKGRILNKSLVTLVTRNGIDKK